MSTASTLLALLRGINVGGHRKVPKGPLVHCFESLGFQSVRTYIQSGNVLFCTHRGEAKELTEVIETALLEHFTFEIEAVVLSRERFRSVADAAPPEWGRSELHSHNALFMLAELPPESFLALLPSPLTQYETVAVGPCVIYWSVLKEQQNKTAYAKLSGSSTLRRMTARNHRTVFKLSDLLDDDM